MEFKIHTGVALWLFVDEKYILSNAFAQREPAQHVLAIMPYVTGVNIFDVPGQLSFSYEDLAFELRIFIVPAVELTKALEFIF